MYTELQGFNKARASAVVGTVAKATSALGVWFCLCCGANAPLSADTTQPSDSPVAIKLYTGEDHIAEDGCANLIVLITNYSAGDLRVSPVADLVCIPAARPSTRATQVQEAPRPDAASTLPQSEKWAWIRITATVEHGLPEGKTASVFHDGPIVASTISSGSVATIPVAISKGSLPAGKVAFTASLVVQGRELSKSDVRLLEVGGE